MKHLVVLTQLQHLVVLRNKTKAGVDVVAVIGVPNSPWWIFPCYPDRGDDIPDPGNESEYLTSQRDVIGGSPCSFGCVDEMNIHNDIRHDDSDETEPYEDGKCAEVVRI